MSTTQTPNEPVLRDAVMHLYKPTEPATARIVRNEICTASRKAAGFVRHIEFDVSGTNLVGRCVAGQSIGVIPPGVDEHGRSHKVRLYSLASPSSGEEAGPHILSTTVKRTIDEHWENHKLFTGVASNFLCNSQPGDEIKVSGPNGKRFVLPVDPHAHDYLFFATGTGIAPFRGMVMELLNNGFKGNLTLVMGSPYASDLIYHEQFLQLASKHRNFNYLTAVSREKQHDGHDRMYVQDRLRTNQDQLAAQLASERNLIYVCGIAGMEMGIFQRLATDLPPAILEQYLHIDAELRAHTESWERRMINREIKPTKRVFLEVYA